MFLRVYVAQPVEFKAGGVASGFNSKGIATDETAQRVEPCWCFELDII